jgi:hypothetical protein
MLTTLYKSRTTPNASTKAKISPPPHRQTSKYSFSSVKTAPSIATENIDAQGGHECIAQGTGHVQHATNLSPQLGKWSVGDLGEELRPGPSVPYPAASYE